MEGLPEVVKIEAPFKDSADVQTQMASYEQQLTAEYAAKGYKASKEAWKWFNEQLAIWFFYITFELNHH